LLVNYCAKFNDSENQLLYLNYLREIYEEDHTIAGKMNLLKLKRNLAMLFSQRRMQKNTMELLYEIKVFFALIRIYKLTYMEIKAK
jgi:hypothetical protein